MSRGALPARRTRSRTESARERPRICNNLRETRAGIFSPDGKLYLAWVGSGLKVFDAERAERVHLDGGHGGTVQHLAPAPDGKRLLSASDDGSVRLWEGTHEVRRWRADTGYLAFAPQGDRFVMAAWDPETYPVQAIFIDPTSVLAASGGVRSIEFGPSASRVAVTNQGTIDLTTPGTPEPTDKLTITPRVHFQQVETNGWNLYDIYNILANEFMTTRPAISMQSREEFTQLGEEFTDDFTLADVDIRYDFGDSEFASISSYVDRDIDIIRDTTALTASFTGGRGGDAARRGRPSREARASRAPRRPDRSRPGA